MTEKKLRYKNYGLGVKLSKEALRDRSFPIFPILATCCTLAVSWAGLGAGALDVKKKRKEGYMGVFQAIIIDARKGKVLRAEYVVGVDEADAALLLNLTEEEKKLKSKDELAVVWNEIGEFESKMPKRIRIEKDEE